MPAWWSGHLGPTVSALVDGQLDKDAAERAWSHVMSCPSCHREVVREGWVKRRLTESTSVSGPPEHLLGSLHCMAPAESADRSWAAVEELERRGRFRRGAGIAMVGVGSVSAAVLGVTLSGSLAAPAGGPAATLTRPAPNPAAVRDGLTPSAAPRGRAPRWATPGSDTGIRSVSVRP